LSRRLSLRLFNRRGSRNELEICERGRGDEMQRARRPYRSANQTRTRRVSEQRRCGLTLRTFARSVLIYFSNRPNASKNLRGTYETFVDRPERVAPELRAAATAPRAR